MCVCIQPLGKSLKLFRHIFSHDTPFCSQSACHCVWTAFPAVFSEVDLHFLYYVSAFVCTVSVSGVCVCGGGGVHVCTLCLCVCRVYVCSECIYALRSCVFLK